MTVSQMREIFTRLLRNPPPTPRQIARQITLVLTRNEESRIYSWHSRTGQLPPPLKPGAYG